MTDEELGFTDEFLAFAVKTSSQYDVTTRELAAACIRLRAENRRLVEVCRWGLGYAQRVGDRYAERLFRAAMEKE